MTCISSGLTSAGELSAEQKNPCADKSGGGVAIAGRNMLEPGRLASCVGDPSGQAPPHLLGGAHGFPFPAIARRLLVGIRSCRQYRDLLQLDWCPVPRAP